MSKVCENETVAEIVKRVRRDCNSYPLPNAAAEMLKLVREVEAAHQREVAELRECLKEATELICDTYCESDNCDCCARNTKWRNALKGAKDEGK